jgi:hypothetical protein
MKVFWFKEKTTIMKANKKVLLKNLPLVAIDSKLDKLRDRVLFTEKLEKANRVLQTAKLPNKK